MQTIEEVLNTNELALKNELTTADWWAKRRMQILQELVDIESKKTELRELREAKETLDISAPVIPEEL